MPYFRCGGGNDKTPDVYGLLIVNYPSGQSDHCFCTNSSGSKVLSDTQTLFYINFPDSGTSITCTVTLQGPQTITRTVEFTEAGQSESISIKYHEAIYAGSSDISVFRKVGNSGGMRHNANAFGGSLEYWNCMPCLGGDEGIDVTGHTQMVVLVCSALDITSNFDTFGIVLTRPTSVSPTWASSVTLPATSAITPITVIVPLVDSNGNLIQGKVFPAFKNPRAGEGNAMYIASVVLM